MQTFGVLFLLNGKKGDNGQILCYPVKKRVMRRADFFTELRRGVDMRTPDLCGSSGDISTTPRMHGATNRAAENVRLCN